MRSSDEADSGTLAGSPLRGVGALAGIRIADFTWVVAGPHATRLLADLGAEVIKIERLPEPGVAPSSIRGRFDLWGQLNRGKLSVALDLNQPAGRALARRIIALSDVVIDNFSPRVLANFGLDYAALAAEQPELIGVSLSGIGYIGPLRDWVTFGPAIHALAGHTALIAEPGGPPAGYGFAYADTLAGYAGAFAVLAALRERRLTGRGQFVDISQWEVAAEAIGPAWLDLTANGRAAVAQGNLSPDGPAAPDGLYPCQGEDAWCAIVCRTDTEWEALKGVLGWPEWAQDSRFELPAGRVAHRAGLDRQLAAWTRDRPAEQMMAVLQAAGVPAGAVLTAADLVERDPQLQHRGYWQKLIDPVEGSGIIEASPLHLSSTPPPISRLAPYPGEDSERILEQLLGLTPVEVADLRRRRVIG